MERRAPEQRAVQTPEPGTSQTAERAEAAPVTVLQHLQRVVGNQAVQRLVRGRRLPLAPLANRPSGPMPPSPVWLRRHAITGIIQRNFTYPLNVPELPPSPASCTDPLDAWPGLPEVATFIEELATLYADRLTAGSLRGVRRRAAQRAVQAVREAGRQEGETRADFRQRVRDARDAAMNAERDALREQELARRQEQLREDFAATVRNAPGRRAYQGEGSLNEVARGWMTGQRERLLFDTEMRTERGRQIPLARISPPEERQEFEPLVRGNGPAVDPRLNRYIEALDRRHPGLGYGNYHHHGGGDWKDRGLSIDISIRGRRDERGFYDPDTAVEVLRAAHETATGLGGDWRALYNDFRVAQTINRETGAQHVRFAGTPGNRLNWHGPLVLHIHIDYQPPPSAAAEAGGTAQRQPAGSAPTTLTRIARQATIQRSPLSREVARIWQARHDKGAVFDRLRAGAPALGDAELTAVLTRIFAAGSDDLWLAQQIQQHGPEPLWPAAAIAERGRRAREHRWAAEPGHIQASLATTAGGRPINAFFFPGRTDERALIISGVHGSELSGIEVVERLLDGLRTGPRPHHTVIIVPRLFPDNADLAESRPGDIGSTANVGRHTADNDVDPNRQFPLPGRAFDPANPVDAGRELRGGRRGRGRRIEPENVALLELIDRFQPSRIASVHAVRASDVAGIFADPRADAEGRALGFAEDERLALEMARRARRGGANVPANQLESRTPNAIYPRDSTAVAAGAIQPRDTSRGVSLGGWGATEVRDPGQPGRNRAAMTVITVEVQTARRIQDASAGQRDARLREIEAHASALREIFLGPPRPAPRR